MENLIQVDSNYIPGVCNIGPDEIAMRRRSFLFTLLATLVLSALPFIFSMDQAWRLLLVLPWLATGITFLQVKNKFCVAYGWLSVFNFDQLGSKRNSVKETEDIRKDKKRVRTMLIQSLVFGVAVTLVLYII